MILGNRASMNENMDEQLNELRSYGLQLAEQKDRVLYEDKYSKLKVTMGQVMESCGPGMDDDWVRAGTAIMLENTRKYFGTMSEATRLVNVGDFQKYAFNMVRALFPSLAAHELASVQAMAGPVSLVFFMKFIYNTTKGTAVAGQDIIENPNESFTSELIDSEAMWTGTGASGHGTGNLAFTPIKPGTLQITALASGVAMTAVDDGNGIITGDVTGATQTIDYETGAFDITFSSSVDLGASVTATYSYDAEANSNIAEVDLTLTSAPVTAITRKLRTRWSIEAQQDLKNLHGLDAEIEQVAGITSELKFEIDREVIRDLKNIALNPIAAFSRTPASGLSFTEHKLLFVDKLIQCSNAIFQRTQRAVGTWAIGGTNVASLVESLPGFVGFPKPPNTRGVYKSGRLNNQWDFWKDPTYPGATRNSTDANGFMVGYKGTMMWEVGYIFAPYILAFTTPTSQLDDFVARKGIASRYGKKAVDGRFFSTSSISGNTF